MKIIADKDYDGIANLSFEKESDTICAIAHAFNSPIRLNMLNQIYEKHRTLKELAELNDLALSTAAFHVDILKDVGIVNIEYVPSKRGFIRLVYPTVFSFHLSTKSQNNISNSCHEKISMPVGYFSTLYDVNVGGAFVTNDEIVGAYQSDFFKPSRFEAQLIWTHDGSFEYAFPCSFLSQKKCIELSFSLEICSEASGYNNDYKSDITFWLNGKELCTYTCPGDFGGRRGINNPPWWPDTHSQYGQLKMITINNKGVYLDGVFQPSKLTLNNFSLDGSKPILFRVGNKPDAKFPNGMNIFGKDFGDHAQDIELNIITEP